MTIISYFINFFLLVQWPVLFTSTLPPIALNCYDIFIIVMLIVLDKTFIEKWMTMAKKGAIHWSQKIKSRNRLVFSALIDRYATYRKTFFSQI